MLNPRSISIYVLASGLPTIATCYLNCAYLLSLASLRLSSCSTHLDYSRQLAFSQASFFLLPRLSSYDYLPSTEPHRLASPIFDQALLLLRWLIPLLPDFRLFSFSLPSWLHHYCLSQHAGIFPAPGFFRLPPN